MKVGTDSVLLGSWASPAGENILDIGTGSGLLALMIAQRNTTALIDAVELSSDAAMQARDNFQNSPWTERLSIFQQDILDFFPERKYDMIITNPPYFTNSTLPPSTARLTARHTASLSPLELLEKTASLLTQEGEFNIILPAAEGKIFIHQASRFSLFPRRIAEFKPAIGKPIERLLIALTRKPKGIEKEAIPHYDEKGQWSQQYKDLTREFYIVL